MMRSLGISMLSLTLTTIVVANAYYQKKQFYPSVVYITKSNPSMAVIYMQAFICVLIVGKMMRKIFFGQLRSAEFEHLMERSWYAITETCLAFTVFRDDFNPKFVALFTLLLFLKSFHWLAEDRVDYMERSPVISLLFHIRVLSLLLLLSSLDLHFIQHAYQSTVTKGASVQLVFGFEYAILLTVVINIAIKYALHSVDLNSETPWDNKAVFLLYTELVMGLIKVVLYVAFVGIMVRIYTLPLFAFRPMYYTIRNFKKAFTDVILSRRAIHNMNTLYPDATSEELQAADNVCIICREEMTTASKKLPCNHIFHTSCLRSWFQRQQTCPTCRLNILRAPNTTNPNEARNEQQRHRPMPQPNPFFNPFDGRFAFPQQPGGVPQAAAPNAAGVPNGATVQPPPQAQANVAAGTAANNNNNQGGANLPPFVFPPFPFMPFMAPPPMPPPNFRTLSPEELQRMEGNERENVEARIQCLRNIQIMLDAAVVMMQQYSAASSLSMQMPTSQGNNHAAGTSEASTQQPGPSTTPTSQSSPSKCNGMAAAAATDAASSISSVLNNNNVNESSDNSAAADAASRPGTSDSNHCTNNVSSTPNINEATTTTTSPFASDDELRRRRLQRFQQNNEQQ